ncbi:MAG: hypothetical protein JXQ66_05600 [Campylobacterales bacterium]|nr:hypothetical protein [Campylobacterales bacterium]
MSKIEKIKRVVMIAIGFGLSTYLIMSGMAMLEEDEKRNVEKTTKH